MKFLLIHKTKEVTDLMLMQWYVAIFEMLSTEPNICEPIHKDSQRL